MQYVVMCQTIANLGLRKYGLMNAMSKLCLFNSKRKEQLTALNR